MTVIFASAVVLLAGCSALRGAPTSRRQPESVAGTPSPTGPPQVAHPWHAGMKELGVNVLWEDSKQDDDDMTRAKAQRMLDYLVSLNVNSIAVNVPFIIDNPRASRVKPDPARTPTAERMRIFFEEAAARKFRMTLRPYLDEMNLVPTWRGLIKPADRDTWFASYLEFLKPYAQMARDVGVTEIVIGVELNSLQADARWKPLIASVRQIFQGRLTYSINYDAYQRKVGTPAVDGVGVDAYFKVNAPDDASVATLAAAWVNWIQHYAGAGAGSLILQEVGIAAENGAYLHPGQWGNKSAPVNLAVQNNWYSAVCQAFERTGLAGVYFWNVRLHQNPGHEDPQTLDRMGFVDRPAAETLKSCFSRLSGS